MDFNNKHIVLIILVIVIFVFVYNFDVYVIRKGKPICKPIYVVKRQLEPETIKDLSESEKVVINEAFTTDYFGNIELQEDFSNQYKLPPRSLLSFHITKIKNKIKFSVMDSVIKVLSYIPTNLSENKIKEMLEYFGLIYETTDSLDSFYKSVSSSVKINSSPYNTKYSQLILFLIGKFNNDYNFYNEQCGVNTTPTIKTTAQEYLNKTEACQSQNLLSHLNKPHNNNQHKKYKWSEEKNKQENYNNNYDKENYNNNYDNENYNNNYDKENYNNNYDKENYNNNYDKENYNNNYDKENYNNNYDKENYNNYDNNYKEDQETEYYPKNQEEIEDSVIHEIENELDQEFSLNSQKRSKNKRSIRNNSTRKGKLSPERTNKKFTQKYQKSNNSSYPPKNCGCKYTCTNNDNQHIQEEFGNAEILESYNSVDYDSFARPF